MTSSPSHLERQNSEARPALASSPPALAFDELYDAHFELVWRFAAFRGVPQAELSRAVRDVFSVARRQLPGLAAARVSRAWLAGLACDVIRGYRRRRESASTAEALLADELFADGSSEPLHELDRKTASELTQLILSKMSEPEREAFCLCELELLSASEALEALELDEATLAARLREACKVFNAMSARVRAQRFWISRDAGRQP